MGKIRNWVIRILAVVVVIGLILIVVHKFVTPLGIFGGDKEVKLEEKVEKTKDKSKDKKDVNKEDVGEEDTNTEEATEAEVNSEVKEDKPAEADKTDQNKVSEVEVIEKAKSLDYGKIASDGYQKAKKLEPKDRELRKWIIRMYFYSKVQDIESTDAELIEAAKATVKIRTAFNKVAKDKYGVKISDSELNEYIKSQAKNTAETTAFAKALSMEVGYFNNEYERDQYAHQLTLQKIEANSEKFLAKKDGETEEEYVVRFNELLNQDIKAAIK